MFALIQKVYGACDPDVAPGDGGIDLGCELKLSDSTAVKDVYTDPAFLVNLLVRNIFPIAGLIIFLMVFYAGFKFIYQGTKGKDEAKGIITACLVGFLLMFSAYWIIQIITLVTGIDVGL